MKISDGATWYASFENKTINPWGKYMYSNVSQQCDKKIVKYLGKLEDSNYNFKDIKSIAEFNHSNIRLYDLDNDPSEKHDLFTSLERYETLARDMYDYLGEQTQEMSDLLFFVGDEYRDVPSAYKEYSLDPPLPIDKDNNIEEINKWRPWL